MIRLVRESDLASWRELRANLYTEMTEAENIAETLAMLEPTPRQSVFVYEENGDVIGMVEVGLRDYAEGCNTSPVGYIEGWSVREDARRRGIGRALFAAAEDWARARGCTEIASDALLDNAISIEAHGRLGYTEIERHVCFRKPL